MKPISDEQKMEALIAALEKNVAKVEQWSWLARETKTISNTYVTKIVKRYEEKSKHRKLGIRTISRWI